MSPRRPPLGSLGALALVVGLALLPHPAAAQGAGSKEAGKEQARALMDEADRLVEERKLEGALALYQRAHALVRVPTTGIEVARTLAAMGKSVEAIEAALAVQRLPRTDPEPKAFAAARKEAEDLAARLTLRVPTVQLDLARQLDVNRVRVDVDEQVVPPELVAAPRAMNPGRHVIRVSAPGRVAKTFTVDLKDGARMRLKVVLEEGDAASLPPLAIAGIAVAGVGLVVGTITGVLSLGQAEDAKDACGTDTKNCSPSASSAITSAKTTGWISTISFALALGGGGLAAHALLTRPDPNATSTALGPAGRGAPGAGLSIGPAGPGLGLGGVF